MKEKKNNLVLHSNPELDRLIPILRQRWSIQGDFAGQTKAVTLSLSSFYHIIAQELDNLKNYFTTEELDFLVKDVIPESAYQRADLHGILSELIDQKDDSSFTNGGVEEKQLKEKIKKLSISQEAAVLWLLHGISFK